jgi:hypothetical protein
MTVLGGKPVPGAPFQPPSPRFAPLRALVTVQPKDVADTFDGVAKALKDYEGPIRLHVRLVDGEKVDHWDVQSGVAKPAAKRGHPKSADVLIAVSPDIWLQIVQGRLSPFDALFAGKLRIGGDVEVAKRVARYLTAPGATFVSPC